MRGLYRGSKAGFTLVEVLVVLFIITILASFIYTGFAAYVAEQQFKSGVVEVSSLMREARQRTLAAEGDQRHGVHFATTTLTAFTGRSYDPTAPTNDATEFAGLTLTPNLSGGTTSVSFTRLSGVPSATGTVLITSTRTGATSSITITGTGIIE